MTLAEAIAHAGEIETSLMLVLAPAAVGARSHQGGHGGGETERSLERPGTASLAWTGAAARAMEAAGRSDVAAFLAECVRQLEAQEVVPCASA